MIEIVTQDAVEWAKNYSGPKFHALLCDPPYHLTTIVKRFGKEGSAPAQFGTDGVYARASKGFMGKTWDGGDVAFDPATWAAFMEVLHPGAFGMAFASSRGWHRLACAIEDAGYIIFPSIFGWVNAQSFPKATRIDTQIDRSAGKLGERKVTGRYQLPGGREWNLEQAKNPEVDHAKPAFTGSGTRTLDIVEPATDIAKAWSGHRYGGQALKNSLEPIIVFQKPYEGRPVDCMVETGAGALNIDGARIPTDPAVDDPRLGGNGDWSTDKAAKTVYEGGYSGERITSSPLGRWPANFILEDAEAAAALDAQSGPTVQLGPALTGDEPSAAGTGQVYAMRKRVAGAVPHDSPSGASRFFFRVQEQLDESDPVYYCSKASGKERNAGLTGKSNHPTHKPIDLCRYLATLLLPPGMYAPRRVFVPFAGVASECIGAFQAGWEDVVGIEREEDYAALARQRAEHWQKKRFQQELF